MATNRLWIGGTAIVVVAVLALGWVLGISPKLAEAAAADNTRQSVDAANTISLQELAALKKQFEGIDGIRDDLDELQKSVPVDADMPDFIRQLNSLAGANGVAIKSIDPQVATAWTKPAGPLLDGDGKPLNIAALPDGIVIIPVTIKFEGPTTGVMNFTFALQHGERLFLANAFTAAGTSDEVDLTKAEITGWVFVLTGSRARPTVDPNSTATPTPTPTPTPTATGTPTSTPTATP